MTLRIEDLNFAYRKGTPVLNNVTFSLEQGQVGMLLGKNGAGKSTLFKCVLGLEKPNGNIYLDDEIINKLSIKERAKKISYVPQQIVFGDLTVFDTVLTGRASHFGYVVGKEDKEIVKEVLRDLGISDLADKNVNNLSGGERQKVAIARALASRPSLLICDEPTGNLDVKNEQLLYRLVKDVAATKNVAVLMTVHNLQFAMQIGDVFFLLKDGEIIKSGDENIVTKESIREVYDVDADIVIIENTKHIIIRS